MDRIEVELLGMDDQRFSVVMMGKDLRFTSEAWQLGNKVHLFLEKKDLEKLYHQAGFALQDLHYRLHPEEAK